MTEPEIDEAAAVATMEACRDYWHPESEPGNIARAALRWKTRAGELDALKHALVCAIDSPKDHDRIGEAVVNVLRSYRARAEAAEAERDSLQGKCYALESHAHGLENRATAAERLADRLLDEARKGGWK